MGVWGKILVGTGGFVLGGPLGALLGAVVGHAIDEVSTGGPAPPRVDQERDVAFTIAFVALAAKVAKVDGAVTRPEIDAFRDVIRVAPEELRNVGRLFDQARKIATGYEPYARQVAELFHDQPEVLEKLLAALFYIARADGRLVPEELDYLENVATLFGFGAADFNRFRSTWDVDAATVEDPYMLLGVSRTQSAEEIKRAWRRQVAENHPDKLMAQGLPAEFVALATRKVARLNDAWKSIKDERGIR